MISFLEFEDLMRKIRTLCKNKKLHFSHPCYNVTKFVSLLQKHNCILSIHFSMSFSPFNYKLAADTTCAQDLNIILSS